MDGEATNPAGANADATGSGAAQPEGSAAPVAGTQEQGLSAQILDSVSSLIDRKFSEFAKELTATEPDEASSGGNGRMPVIPEPETEEWAGQKAVIQGVNALLEYVGNQQNKEVQQQKENAKREIDGIAERFIKAHPDIDAAKLERVYRRANEIYSREGALEAAYRELYPQKPKSPVVTEPPKTPAATLKPPVPAFKSKEEFRAALGKEIEKSLGMK